MTQARIGGVIFVALWQAAMADAGLAQLRGTIFGPGSTTFPMAVASLQTSASGTTPALAAQFADIVTRDLTLSGLVRVIPRERHTDTSGGTTDDTINFDGWSAIGALALVAGTLQEEGGQLTVEARLFDVYQRRQLVGRRYHGGPGDVRRMAHRFADEILTVLTRERGPFDSQIAFLSTRGGRFKDVYVMSLDGGDVRRLTDSGTLNVSPAWAPNTRSVLFSSYRRRTPDLFAIDMQTRQVSQLTRLGALTIGGEWSPDGSQLAVAVERDGNTDIEILDSGGSVRRRLTDHWAIDVSPSWSPDGTQIAFCSSRSGGPQIYIIGADGSGLRRVTHEGAYNTSPSWSPKGDRIAYASRIGGRFQICTVGTSGDGTQQVTTSAGSNEDPSWAPDGRYLVFSSTRGGRARLYIADAVGTSQVELTGGNGDDTSPAWSRWLD